MPRGARSSFLGACCLRYVSLTVVPLVSPVPSSVGSPYSSLVLDTLSVLVVLPLAGVRFAFSGVIGSGRSFPSFVPLFLASALAAAIIVFFGEAGFFGEGVIGSVTSLLALTSISVEAVTFLIGERF